MVQRYEQMRRLQWYKRGAAYENREGQPQIVMDSVMDFSVFEESITLFKYLYINILRCVRDANRDG